ncbi:MAG: CoA transferase, partial [Halieaceae bacterium]
MFTGWRTCHNCAAGGDSRRRDDLGRPGALCLPDARRPRCRHHQDRAAGGGYQSQPWAPRQRSEDVGALPHLQSQQALGLKSDAGREAALKLIKTADVVVHNFRPQAMERLGLDYEQVKAVNPSVVYCATYGYSKKGPYGDKGALDDSIQAASGIAILQSMVEGEPRYLPTIIADKTTGLMVVQSVLAALFHRERTGEGQSIEVPM